MQIRRIDVGSKWQFQCDEAGRESTQYLCIRNKRLRRLHTQFLWLFVPHALRHVSKRREKKSAQLTWDCLALKIVFQISAARSAAFFLLQIE
jgi:hypothetical protein